MSTTIFIALLITLALVAYQDFKDRAVWAFLFPLLIVLGGYLYFSRSFYLVYLYMVGYNLLIISTVLLLSLVYSKFVLKKDFLKEVMGLGDILFYVFMAVSFPTLAFLVFFVCAVLFSLIVHQFASKKEKARHNPFAGYVAIFIMGVYGVELFGFYNSIYSL